MLIMFFSDLGLQAPSVLGLMLDARSLSFFGFHLIIVWLSVSPDPDPDPDPDPFVGASPQRTLV